MNRPVKPSFSASSVQGDESLTTLVSAVDPRATLRAELDSSSVAMANRQHILEAQMRQLSRELEAVIDAKETALDGVRRLDELITKAQELSQIEDKS